MLYVATRRPVGPFVLSPRRSRASRCSMCSMHFIRHKRQKYVADFCAWCSKTPLAHECAQCRSHNVSESCGSERKNLLGWCRCCKHVYEVRTREIFGRMT